MDLSGLETLKQKLIEATEFAPVWDYFMTHFGEQRAFMALGKRTRSPMLEAAIAQAAEEVFGAWVPVTNLLLVRLPEYQFMHGALVLEGRFANVFYFEDLGMGLLTIILSMAGDNNRLVRFTARDQPGGEAGAAVRTDDRWRRTTPPGGGVAPIQR